MYLRRKPQPLRRPSLLFHRFLTLATGEQISLIRLLVFFYKITIFHNFCSPSSTGKQIFDQTLLVTNSPFLFTIINWLNISLIRLFVVDNITIFVHHHQLVTKSLIIQWWQHYLFCSPSSYVATSSCLLDKKLNQNYLEPSLVHCRDNVAQHLNALLAPFQMCPIRHSCWRS